MSTPMYITIAANAPIPDGYRFFGYPANGSEKICVRAIRQPSHP